MGGRPIEDSCLSCRPMTQSDTTTLSEAASKELLSGFGVRFAQESRAAGPAEAVEAAESIGFPVVLKLSGDGIAHKTERGLVVVGLSDGEAVDAAAQTLLGKARPEDGPVELLVAEQVAGARELITGLVRDPQFGPCVVVGLGGILTEALEDVAFAATPLTRPQAEGLIEQLNASHLFTRPFRGEPALARDALADVLLGLSRLAEERPEVASVDLNPLIVCQGSPVAVDALVELGEPVVEAAAQALQLRAGLVTSGLDPVDEGDRRVGRPGGLQSGGERDGFGRSWRLGLRQRRRFGPGRRLCRFGRRSHLCPVIGSGAAVGRRRGRLGLARRRSRYLRRGPGRLQPVEEGVQHAVLALRGALVRAGPVAPVVVAAHRGWSEERLRNRSPRGRAPNGPPLPLTIVIRDLSCQGAPGALCYPSAPCSEGSSSPTVERSPDA